MISPTKCIVCGSAPRPLTWNELPLWQCPRCLLAWQREFRTPADYYRSEEYQWSDRSMPARMRNSVDRAATLGAYMPLDSLCDVGAGEGAFLLTLKAQGHTNLLGIEPHPDAVAYGRAHGVELLEGTLAGHEREVCERAVKSVTLFHVIEHLEDPRLMLHDIYDLLPPRGFLVVETPAADSPVLRAKNYKDKLIYAEHLFYFNEDNLSRLLADAGFIVRACKRRDFDVSHMPLSDSLRRLGLPTNRAFRALLRPFRSVINREIVRRGALNYMLCIAQKP